jgi:hypothetical protein
MGANMQTIFSKIMRTQELTRHVYAKIKGVCD